MAQRANAHTNCGPCGPKGPHGPLVHMWPKGPHVYHVNTLALKGQCVYCVCKGPLGPLHTLCPMCAIPPMVELHTCTHLALKGQVCTVNTLALKGQCVYCVCIGPKGPMQTLCGPCGPLGHMGHITTPIINNWCYLAGIGPLGPMPACLHMQLALRANCMCVGHVAL